MDKKVKACRRTLIWQQIRKMKTFTRRELELAVLKSERIVLNTSQVRVYLNRLKTAGYVETSGEGMDATWILTRNTGVEAPLLRDDGSAVDTGLGREQMWRTIKILKEFSAVDLHLAASTEERSIGYDAARRYILHLYKAGYLFCTQSSTRGRRARYRLIPRRNTGRYAPLVRKNGNVYDPNLQQVMRPRNSQAGATV